MSEVTLSILELGYLKETLEVALEEFRGIEDARGCLEDYVITTGAIEECENALNLIDKLAYRLRKDSLEDDFEDMFTEEELTDARFL